MMLSGIFLGKKTNFATAIHQKIYDFRQLEAKRRSSVAKQHESFWNKNN